MLSALRFGWREGSSRVGIKIMMKRRQFALCIVSAVLFCASAVAQRPTSLRGQITDQLGAVVVGASVTLTDANGRKTATQTDSNGTYRFDNVSGGIYTLAA